MQLRSFLESRVMQQSPGMAITTQYETAASRPSADTSSIEEVERGEIRVIPQGSVEIIPPPVIVNTAPWRFVLGFGGLALVDIAMHTAAGAAAARVGADLNGATPTTLVIQMGALAGVTKAAITTFREIVGLSSVNLVFQILLMLLTSSFGVCALLVTEIGNIVLGETPKQLVIAAVVAAVPLIPEMVRNIQPIPDQDGNSQYYRWVYAIFLIASDALGGYVFARMALNQGMPISNYQAACSAGAVFGTLTWLSRAMTGVVAMIQIPEDGKVSNVFGVYEVVTPDPIIVTEEEYMAMQRGLASLVTGFFSAWPQLMRRFIKFVSCCCCCCVACFGMKESLKEMQEHMDEFEQEEYRNGMDDVGYQLTQQMLPATRVD
ncbi:hypothetical protein SCUP515_02247 [Seiridium cupressi]